MIRFLRRLAVTIRHLRRTRQVVAVLVRHGLSDTLRQIGIDHLIGRIAWRLRLKDEPPDRRPLDRPRSVREALEELGPSFVKLGQILSTRPDLVPRPFLKELEKLQDRVPPFPFEQVRQLLEDEGLEERFAQLTSSLESVPIASATIGQVHRAVDAQGRSWAVKVQRPDVEAAFLHDLEILREIAQFLERDANLRDQFEPVKMVDEIVQSVRRELDFLTEARTIERFRKHFSEHPQVKIPEVHWELTTRRVLVMEFVEGTKLSSVEELDARGLDRVQLSKTFVRALFRQVFEHGVFHADPHPGNLVACSGNVVAFLDFGIVGSLDGTAREQLLEFVHALVRRDAERMVRVATEAGQVPRDVDERQLRHQLGGFLDRWADVPLGQLSMAAVVEEFFEILHRHRIRFPPDLVLLARALTTAEGVARTLDPHMDIFEEARPFVLRSLRDRYRPRRLARQSRETGHDALRLLRDLPRHLERIVKDLSAGRTQIVFHHHGLEELLKELDRSTNRLALGLLVGASIVGSSIVTHAQVGPQIGSMPLLGVIGYVSSAVLGLWLVVSMLRSR